MTEAFFFGRKKGIFLRKCLFDRSGADHTQPWAFIASATLR